MPDGMCEPRCREPSKVGRVVTRSFECVQVRTRPQMEKSSPSKVLTDAGDPRPGLGQGLVDLLQRGAAAGRLLHLGGGCQQLLREAVALAARGEQVLAGLVALRGARGQLCGEALGGVARLGRLGTRLL